MSDPMPPPSESPHIDLDSVVRAFLSAFPEPTDEQLHNFSTVLGIPYEQFEEQVFEMFKDEVEEDLEEVLEDEEIVEDYLDMFLVLLFAFLEEPPSEDQFHALSEMLDIDPEVLEEKVYKILQEIIPESDEDLDDEDEDTEDDESDDSTEELN
jgi:hypothetical protein